MKATIERALPGAILFITTFLLVHMSASVTSSHAAGYEAVPARMDMYEGVYAQRGRRTGSKPGLYLNQRRKNKQTSGEETSTDSLLKVPVECDTALSYLDHALVETFELKDSYLIVIARAGTGEQSSTLNQQRLVGIEKYVKRKFPTLKYVMAEGNKVAGLGRVELYVGGRLLYAMPIKKNAKSHCDDPIGV